jgi:hypothetical protein
MAAVATREKAVVPRPEAGRRSSQLFEPDGVSLEDSILAAWRDLADEGRAVCPVCGGSMSRATQGGCCGCGSELSSISPDRG